MRFLINSATIALLLLSPQVRAAVTITGNAASPLQNFGASANIPDGSLFILVADADGGGTFASSTDLSIAALTTLNVGDTFGTGDKIIYRGSSVSGGFPNLLAKAQVNMSSVDLSATGLNVLGQKFALVWFDTLTSSTTTTGPSGGQHYGFVRSSDWILPATATSTTSFGSNYTSIASPGGASLTINAAPEPSRLMLTALGLGTFLMRRRRVA